MNSKSCKSKNIPESTNTFSILSRIGILLLVNLPICLVFTAI